MPLAWGITAKRGEEILVERVALAVDPLLLRHLGLEPAALLGRVGEFAEGVGEFDPAGIELEALGKPRVVGGRARERRLDDRVFVEDGRPRRDRGWARSSRRSRG